jgi:hypothetical protein
MIHAPPTAVSELADAFGFTLEELALNRAGHLSSAQTWQIAKAALFQGLFALVLVAAAVVVPILVSGKHRIYLVVMFALCVPLVVWFTWTSIADAVERRVSSTDGTVEIMSNAGGRGARLVVGGRKGRFIGIGPPVRSDVDRGSLLRPGALYRVYSLAHSDVLLSLEPL